jgi:hypothetical protein
MVITISSYCFSSSIIAAAPPQGMSLIPPPKIFERCLAAGTRVRLATQGEKSIEDFKGAGGEIILGAGGTTREVIAISSGVEPYPMIHIVATGKRGQPHDLLLTRTHPVMTPEGAVLARDLKKGDKVLTIDGVVSLDSVTQEMYGGRVHNIKTGQNSDAEKNLTAFYANGFLVGDIAMQNYYVEKNRKRNVKTPGRQ